MPRLIENRAVGCGSCGYGPIYGQESQTKVDAGLHLEVRWVCPKCGRLVRVDEEVISEN